MLRKMYATFPIRWFSVISRTHVGWGWSNPLRRCSHPILQLYVYKDLERELIYIYITHRWFGEKMISRSFRCYHSSGTVSQRNSWFCLSSGGASISLTYKTHPTHPAVEEDSFSLASTSILLHFTSPINSNDFSNRTKTFKSILVSPWTSYPFIHIYIYIYKDMKFMVDPYIYIYIYCDVYT